jgi:hypothetical protein
VAMLAVTIASRYPNPARSSFLFVFGPRFRNETAHGLRTTLSRLSGHSSPLQHSKEVYQLGSFRPVLTQPLGFSESDRVPFEFRNFRLLLVGTGTGKTHSPILVSRPQGASQEVPVVLYCTAPARW